MELSKIHIGQLVKKVVRENNIKDASFAKNIGKSRQNVYDLYKRNDMEVKLLHTISQVLNYDFFQFFRVGKNEEPSITDVSINLKVKPENLDDLFKWISENGNVNISKK